MSRLRAIVRDADENTREVETMKPTDDRDEPLCFTFCEAATKLHCSVSAVRRLAKAGTLKGFSLSGGTILTRVTALSVRQFVENAHRNAKSGNGGSTRGGRYSAGAWASLAPTGRGLA